MVQHPDIKEGEVFTITGSGLGNLVCTKSTPDCIEARHEEYLLNESPPTWRYDANQRCWVRIE